MATVHCSKCTAERKGFRRELDSWRHKLIHCVGFESILEGIYGPFLLRDLNLFDDCEPEEIFDWSPEGNSPHCLFCKLPLDKLNDQVISATSPLSSSSEYSPRHVPTLSESSQSAHRFLQAVFHKKDVSLGCDSNIPLIAQELMKKMIHQFAMEYASKCLLHTTTNGVPTRTSSPLSETPDAPLDLTVSRAQEEKESQPDGVLDLSNRKCATLKSCVPLLNHKASGCCLPTITQEMGDMEHQGTKCHQNSALGAVFCSLCPAHQSLLYQILKLAHQHKLLLFKNPEHVQVESCCCHCGVNFEDKIRHHQVTLNDCKAYNSGQHCSFQTNCDHCSMRYHPRDSKSNCSTHHYPLKECRNETPQDCCCLPSCRRETCVIICPKRVHCISCQSLPLSNNNINNMVCSFAPSPLSPPVCTSPLSLCSPSYCCNHHDPQSCTCYLNHSCITRDESTKSTENGDPACPVLKREQSPSPPPLSPIPSDVNKQSNERPPSLLHHIQEAEAEPMVKNCLINANQKKSTVKRHQCRNPPTKKNASRTLLQDVVNRFSEKLETINPLEKDATVTVAEKEQPQLASRNIPLNADAHLTEIITTVLHTGSASEYNLSELMNHQDNKEPKSPNTRSRRRQEVLAAMATPADDATTRRHTLKIKRELAMLDQLYSKRKRSKLKYGKGASINTSLSNPVKEECKGEVIKPVQNSEVQIEPAYKLTTETDEGEVKDDTQAEENMKVIKAVEKEAATLKENHPASDSQVSLYTFKDSQSMASGCEVTKCEEDERPETGLLCPDSDGDERPDSDKTFQISTTQLTSSREARKSKRNIVPPPRFSSYVTEPRKMYFVACFSDSIFNHKNRREEIITPLNSSDHEVHQENSASESTNEFSLLGDGKGDDHHEGIQLTTNEKSPIKDKADKLTDSNSNKCVAKHRRRLETSLKKTLESEVVSRKPKVSSDVIKMPPSCIESPQNSSFEYTSPIKLMFVSQVKDEEGIKYSLKSATMVTGSHAEESFDPCEESSWAGSQEKNKIQSTEPAASQNTASPLKSPTSPAKSASLSPRPAFSLNKSSPTKSPSSTKSVSSPKSATSSPKTGLRRSGESTPTKRMTVDGTQRFPGDLSPYHEATPKRRPGRPKKLGPQLEKKVKRPIGRPRKQQVVETATKEKSANGNSVAPDREGNVNKNLKITVVYGRSRRNKRMVSEGFDQLQTEFRDACQAVGLNNNWSMLMNSTKANSARLKTGSDELSQGIPLNRPVKKSVATCKTKCQSVDDTVPSRKPGRPAKVKISGISVTVTTVSPRQRKIQINDTKTSPGKLNHRRVLLQEFVTAKESKTITCHSVSKSGQQEQGMEAKVESTDEQSNPPAAVRHSERVRKPSIHFLHAVATSSSYSCSSALLRRSKQLLLNKANSVRKQQKSDSAVGTSGEKQSIRGREKQTTVSSELQQVATVSVDSIFTQKETLKWWEASAQKKTLNQELARRIRLISDTWVSDTVDNKEVELSSNLGSKGNIPFSGKSKCSSVVRSLFDCSPNKPRSCSMQQLSSWFMQTTETQSLGIVKKTSSRNPYELMHFPRSTNKKNVCYSPQAERLRKHLKKFAKCVPKSPYDYKQAQIKIIKRKKHISEHHFKPQLSICFASGRSNQKAKGRSKSFGKYQATLFRARTRFLTKKERKKLFSSPLKIRIHHKAPCRLNGHVTGLHPKQKAMHKLSTSQLPDCGQDGEDEAKDHLCSKAWSPEKLKECRVFLRKINSSDNETTEEEWDSCTVTLDDGSLLFGKSEGELVEVVKAVKTKRKRNRNRACLSDPESSSPNSIQEPHVRPMARRKGRHRLGVGSDPTQPPPAKMLRQSRMKGLSGPRWHDFVIGN